MASAGSSFPDPAKRYALVREIEVLVDPDRHAADQDVLVSVGTVHATTDEHALTLRLKPGISYQEAVRRLQGCQGIQAIYCHYPALYGWKANDPLPPNTKSAFDAAKEDFAAVAAADRVAKGPTPPRRTGEHVARMPANPTEEQFIIPTVPGQQYYLPPLPGYSHWYEAGPRGFAVGDSYFSGRVDAIAFHPVNADIFYVGSNRGGLWRTRDGGSSYTPLSDRWDSLVILSIAIDGSQNPEKVFVGKGGSEPTLLRSVDGGESFQPVQPAVFASKYVKGIYVVPDTPTTVLAAVAGNDGQLYRSVDGGHVFTPVPTDTLGNSLQGSWRQITGGIKFANTRYIYALGNMGDQTFIARSTDEGATWTKVACPEADAFGEIAASQTRPTIIYYYTPLNKAVWMSVGAAWSRIYSPGDPPYNTDEDRMFNQAGANTMIGVARRTANGVASDVVYVGGVNLMRTTNGGSSWQALDAGHGDYCCFALAPDGDAFLIGTHGGVYRGIEFQGIARFSAKNRGLGITQFYSGAFSPTSNFALLGGTQDNGTASRLDGDDWRFGSGGDGGPVALSTANDDVQFGTDQEYNIYATDDRWQTFDAITPKYGMLIGLNWVEDHVPYIGAGVLEMDPNSGAELYVGTNYLYRYSLLTAQWTKHLAGLNFSPEAGGRILSIKIPRGDINRVYVGGDGGLWMSQDRGAHWTRIDIPAVGAPSAFPGATTFISVHPADKNDVVALVSPGKVYRCANTNAYPRVWTELAQVQGTALARDIDDPSSTFYVSTPSGVVKSIDGGHSWTPYDYGLGLPVVTCKTIASVAATRSLWVATYGRGFWRIHLPAVNLSVQVSPSVQRGRQATATVNLGRQAQPGGENVWLRTNVPGDAPRRLTVLAGATSVTFDVATAGLPAGQTQLEMAVTVGTGSVTRAINVI
jgi:photosystem II stability/assembly factor-like uncharacterized protein